MDPRDLDFLLAEFEKEKRKHDFLISEAKKCLRNMIEIQNELLERGCGVGSR